MDNPTIFPKAPIVEALLDIRVAHPEGMTAERLSSFHTLVKDSFPLKREHVVWQGGFHIQPDARPELISPVSEQQGFFFSSKDGKKTVQVRMDGFTLNVLKPYTQWSQFRDEARALWLQYLEVARPSKVLRLGLRYINNIEIPIPFEDFSEYVVNAPDVPVGLPQGIAELFMRIVLPDPERDIAAIVTHAMKSRSATDTMLPYILDIDVFQDAVYAPDVDFWPVFETMRNYKNQIFFKTITKKAEVLFSE